MPAKQAADPYAQYAQAPATPSDPYAQYAQPDQTAAEPASPSLLSQVGQGAKNYGIGLLKGAGSTMSAADEFSRKHLPAYMTNTGMGFGHPENIPAVKSMMEPQGLAQTLGKGTEQAAEFMIPGGAEKKLLGKAPLLARAAGSALTSGVVNKAQGGDFSTGALMGGGGNLIGEAAKSVAPIMAESALRIGKSDRLGGRQVGKAILEHTGGVAPETVSESAEKAIGRSRANALSSVPPNSTLSLTPARTAGVAAMQPIERHNVPSVIDAGRGLQDVLNTRHATGLPLPRNVPLSEGLDLRTGVGKYLPQGTWNPGTSSRIAPVRNAMYGAMNDEIGSSFPEIRESDKVIKNLIPVVRRGEEASRETPLAQRLMQRAAARTGALTLGGLGATQGYREGGLPGAMAGGVAGFVAPELLADPTGQMIAARTLFSPATRTAGRAVGGGLLQLNRGGQQ